MTPHWLDVLRGLSPVWVAVGVFVFGGASIALPVGESLAFAFFWPIAVPVWLFINLYRLSKRGWREIVA